MVDKVSCAWGDKQNRIHRFVIVSSSTPIPFDPVQASPLQSNLHYQHHHHASQSMGLRPPPMDTIWHRLGATPHGRTNEPGRLFILIDSPYRQMPNWMRVYSSPPPLSSSSSPSSSSASATPRATIPKIVVSTVEVVRNLSPPFIYSIYLSIYPGNTINVKVCAACVMIDVALSHSRSMSNPLYIKSSQSPVVRRLITIIIIAYGFYAMLCLS